VVFSVPTYVFIALMLLLIVVGIAKLWGTHVVPVSTATSGRSALGTAARHRLARWIRVHLSDFARICRRMRCHDGHGGHLQRSQCVPAPKLEERGNHTRMDGRDSRSVLHRHELARQRIQRHADDDRDRPLTAQSADLRLGCCTSLQYATFAILVLAANTAFADFPRLSSILANDRYMPRQFAARGDRLAFSNGIVVLAVVAILLTWLFRGNTAALIPLYAIGVFVCFTLSQAGMVVHWVKERSAGWRRRAVLNGLGAAATGIVAIVQ
jgi:hypothetical protein